MYGASISRWTMSYFAAALAFLLLGQSLLAAGFGYPVLAIEAPETLVVVHIIAIGWLGLLFCGALLQFVPVLVAKPLYAADFSLHALILLVSGLLCLVGGFLALAGLVEAWLVLLPIGASLLISGFGLIIYMLAGTLRAARPLVLPARFVAVGLVSLAATIALGGSFAFTLSGAANAAAFNNLVSNGLSLHAYFGLIGWMTVSAIGVSYRLLAMFLLSPETERPTSRCALVLMIAAITLIGISILAAAADLPTLPCIILAVLIATGAVLLFAFDVLRIYRQRKRKALELNSLMSAAAILALLAAAALFLVLAGTDLLGSQIGPLVYLIVFGWLSMLGLGQLYKIVAFMTWLEYYGPSLGRMPVPRVQDLVNEERASRWFLLYIMSLVVALPALLFDAAGIFRAATCVQAIAVAALVLELVRTRHLRYVAATASANGPAVVPHLFLPNPMIGDR